MWISQAHIFKTSLCIASEPRFTVLIIWLELVPTYERGGWESNWFMLQRKKFLIWAKMKQARTELCQAGLVGGGQIKAWSFSYLKVAISKVVSQSVFIGSTKGDAEIIFIDARFPLLTHDLIKYPLIGPDKTQYYILHYIHTMMHSTGGWKIDKTSWGWAGPSSAQTGTGTEFCLI